jgi:hypothetical protein
VADTTTLNETTRNPIDGTESVRLATVGANWKATIAAIFAAQAPTGGAATLTNHGIVLGRGAAATAATAAMTDGQLLVGQTAADPLPEMISGDITLSPGGVATLKAGVLKTYSAGVDPGAGNDSSQGYAAGSLGVNTSTGRAFVARSVGVGVAVWVLLGEGQTINAIAGNWYQIPGVVVSAGVAVAANSIRLHPLLVNQAFTIASLGVRITTLAAGGNIQLAIYANNYATGRPTGNALSSTASITTATATAVNAPLGASVPVVPGIYWLGMNCDNATAVFQVSNNGSPLMAAIIGSATQVNVSPPSGPDLTLAVAQTFNTWPDLTAASFVESVTQSFAHIHSKIGSVP